MHTKAPYECLYCSRERPLVNQFRKDVGRQEREKATRQTLRRNGAFSALEGLKAHISRYHTEHIIETRCGKKTTLLYKCPYRITCAFHFCNYDDWFDHIRYWHRELLSEKHASSEEKLESWPVPHDEFPPLNTVYVDGPCKVMGLIAAQVNSPNVSFSFDDESM